jgi:hypothetical protein
VNLARRDTGEFGDDIEFASTADGFKRESASRGLNEAPGLHRCPEVRGMPVDGYRGVSVSRSTSPVASSAL